MAGSAHGYFLNIYGPCDPPYSSEVGRQLVAAKVHRPSTMRPGVFYTNAQTSKFAHVGCRDDIQSWTLSNLWQMMEDRRQVDDKFHHFKRLPIELRRMITSYLPRPEKLNFLRTHRGAGNDVSFRYVRNLAIWDRYFKYYTWLDKMSSQGLLPALIRNPYQKGKKMHLALVLIGQTQALDWDRDRRELIETLQSQEGNGYAAVSGRGSLHIGQPFGKTDLQKPPNLETSFLMPPYVRSPRFASHGEVPTSMLYYEPQKFGPHPGTGFHSTTALVHLQDLMGISLEVQDAKQPSLTWNFTRWDPRNSTDPNTDPLLPGGRLRTE